jgi:hypothetical protein
LLLSIFLLVGGLAAAICFFVRASAAWEPSQYGVRRDTYGVWADSWPLALGMGLCSDAAIIGGFWLAALVLRKRFSTEKWVWFLLGGFHMMIGVLSSSIFYSLVATKEDLEMGWVWSEWFWPFLLVVCILITAIGAITSLVCFTQDDPASIPKSKQG